VSSSAPALSTDLLAIVVAVVAFVVSGLFFLVLVPERTPARKAAASETTPESRDQALAADSPRGVPPDTAATLPATPVALGEARIAVSTEAVRYLPVEHDGGRHHLPIDSIVAVHANAHYTYVFDGTAKYFCPLAIGDVESRLDPRRFARVHRSHIINVDYVVRFRRAGDNGLIELKSRDPYTVPVSRSRVAWVRTQLLGPRASAAV
jgi:hypothetical protein